MAQLRDIEAELVRRTDYWMKEIARLKNALDRSVQLQSHYAELLNAYDGGKRLIFVNGEAWLARLHELEPTEEKA